MLFKILLLATVHSQYIHIVVVRGQILYFGVSRVRVLSTSTMISRRRMIFIFQTHLPCRYCAYGNMLNRDRGMYSAAVSVW
jgi:hypothetical protein